MMQVRLSSKAWPDMSAEGLEDTANATHRIPAQAAAGA